MEYTVYILECHNGSYYVGITTDLLRRYQEHLQGINCRYTRAFPAKRVAAAWELSAGGKSLAQKIEYFIKKQAKKTKTELIKNPDRLATLLLRKLTETDGIVINAVTLFHKKS
jgi:putative endonuclease